MTQILVDPVTRERLERLIDPVSLVDDEGRLLGAFCPVPHPPYDPALIPPMSPAEREAALAEPGRYTAEEVLRHLENL